MQHQKRNGRGGVTGRLLDKEPLFLEAWGRQYGYAATQLSSEFFTLLKITCSSFEYRRWEGQKLFLSARGRARWVAGGVSSSVAALDLCQSQVSVGPE